jgi:hypothetical protein
MELAEAKKTVKRVLTILCGNNFTMPTIHFFDDYEPLWINEPLWFNAEVFRMYQIASQQDKSALYFIDKKIIVFNKKNCLGVVAHEAIHHAQHTCFSDDKDYNKFCHGHNTQFKRLMDKVIQSGIEVHMSNTSKRELKESIVEAE